MTKPIKALKIFVIGPIFPFRGGIAHSNRVLCENLSKSHQVTAISFSRMYPEFLFPGKSQKEVNSGPDFSIPTEYVLDSVNLLSWKKIADKIKKEEPDWVVFQWWHTFFAPAYWTIAKFGKNPQTKFLVICQNLSQHEGSVAHNVLNAFLHYPLTKLFFAQVDRFITLSSSDLKDLKTLLPTAHADWITESTYETQFGEKPSKEEARKKIGIQTDAILFFGFVRPYKGLKFLLQSLPIVLKKKPDLKLIIVGEFWNDKKEYFDLIEKLGLSKNLLIVDKYVSNEEVPAYFAAADAVVLPYTSSTESGIIQLAYGLNTPVITTAVGGNVDLIENEKTGMLCKPENPTDLAKKILDFYEKNFEKTIQQGMKANADLFKWTAEKERVFFGKTK